MCGDVTRRAFVTLVDAQQESFRAGGLYPQNRTSSYRESLHSVSALSRFRLTRREDTPLKHIPPSQPAPTHRRRISRVGAFQELATGRADETSRSKTSRHDCRF
nr:hypothetical protein CFP56_10376 [Quercus suber]